MHPNKSIVYLGYTGLGDNIITNGLVRHLATQYDTVYFPCKPHNEESVQWMFSDLPNVKARQMAYWMHEDQLIDSIVSRVEDPMQFDREFYRTANVPYEYKVSKFHVPVKKLPLSKLLYEFIFVHDDSTRGFNIPNSRLPNIKITRPARITENIFLWREVIKQAKEIHCISSSFAHWIALDPYFKDIPKFLHRYARQDGTWCNFHDFVIVD